MKFAKRFSNFSVQKTNRPAHTALTHRTQKQSSTVHSQFYTFHWSIPYPGERSNGVTLKVGTGNGKWEMGKWNGNAQSVCKRPSSVLLCKVAKAWSTRSKWKALKCEKYGRQKAVSWFMLLCDMNHIESRILGSRTAESVAIKVARPVRRLKFLLEKMVPRTIFSGKIDPTLKIFVC